MQVFLSRRCSHEKQIEVWEAQDDGTSPDVAASSTTIFDRLTGTSQRTGHLCCKSGGQLIIRVWLFGRYLCIPLSSHGSIQPSLSTINDSVWRFGRRLFLSLSYPPECRARENNDRGSDSGSYAMRSSLVSPEKKPGYNSGTTVELVQVACTPKRTRAVASYVSINARALHFNPGPS